MWAVCRALTPIGLEGRRILHTHIFANHLEFGNNDIVVWEVVQLEPCRDVDVGDVGVGFIIFD